jgi:menaquinone-9 beta-reductase
MTDVLIAGAGPAGATLAMLLARAGCQVELLDRAAFPRSKPCAEYMSPGTVRLLHALGAGERVEALAGARLRGFTVTAQGRASMRGAFGRAPGWPQAPDYGLGVAREQMDAALVTLACEAGATLRERTRVTDVMREGTFVRGVSAATQGTPALFHARLVVGADGVNGVVGRRLGMIGPKPVLRRFGLVAHMTGIDGLGEFGEMHVGATGYCGVAPLGHGVANLAMVLRPDAATHPGRDVESFFQGMLGTFGDLGRRAERVRPAGPVLRTGPLSYHARVMTGDGVLLVGDAGGFYDPFTGQGVYRALRSAQLAAPVILEALARNDVSRARLLPYEQARRREFRGAHAVEWLIQRFLAHPLLLRRAVRLLGRRTAMADTLVGVTGDVLPACRVLTPRFLARLAI